MPVHLNVNNAEALAPALRAGLAWPCSRSSWHGRTSISGALQTAMDDWQVESIALHIVTPPGCRRPARAGTDRIPGRALDRGNPGQRRASVEGRGPRRQDLGAIRLFATPTFSRRKRPAGPCTGCERPLSGFCRA